MMLEDAAPPGPSSAQRHWELLLRSEGSCGLAQGTETLGAKGKNWEQMEPKPVQDHEQAPWHDADSPAPSHPAQTSLCH